MSNEKIAFEVARENGGVSTASSIGITRSYCAYVSGCPLHQSHLSKMATIKCNLKTSMTKCSLGPLFSE